MRPELLIFDLDGTLIDSVPDLALAINLALTDLALPICSEEQVRDFVGNGSYVLCQRVLNAITANTNDINVDKLHDLFLHHYATHSNTHSKPYDGVVDGLNHLAQAGYRLALATNKPAQFVPAILQYFDLARFELVVGGDSLPAKKPDPMPLLYICQTLGVQVEHAVMIGDSKNDMLAGKNAGMTTLALTYGYNHGEAIDKTHPDKIFDDFTDLCNYLLNLS